MFGLEAWHGLVLGSLISAGLFSFLAKIAAERGHSPAFFNAISAVVAALCALLMVSTTGFAVTASIVFFAVVSALMYIYGSIARSEALEHIHTTLFFPIYKIVGPTLVLIGGLIFFGERLTALQWIGFLLVVLVPVLLIDRLERTRQNDLTQGLRLAIISAVLISLGQLMGKAASYADAATYGFLVINYLITAFGAAMLFWKSPRRNNHRVSVAELYGIAAVSGIFQFLGFSLLILAYRTGPISTVYAINSTYIVIPIILSVLFYGEHWNMRKVAAIALSVVAVVLLR